MRTMLMLMAVMFAMSACSFAGVEARRAGRYHVNGYTSDPAGFVTAASNAVVQEDNAQTYQKAVERGMAYPYYGGGYSNDYEFYYGGVVPPGAPAYGPQDDQAAQQALEEAKEARRRADDALRMQKKLKKELGGGK